MIFFLHARRARTHARTHAHTHTHTYTLTYIRTHTHIVQWVTTQFTRLFEARVGRGKCDSRDSPSSGGNYYSYSVYDRVTAVCHSICPSLPFQPPPQQPSESLVSDCSLSCGDSSALNDLKVQDVDTCIQAELCTLGLFIYGFGGFSCRAFSKPKLC